MTIWGRIRSSKGLRTAERQEKFAGPEGGRWMNERVENCLGIHPPAPIFCHQTYEKSHLLIYLKDN